MFLELKLTLLFFTSKHETQTENEAVAENWNWFGDQLSSNVVFASVSRQNLVTDRQFRNNIVPAD